MALVWLAYLAYPVSALLGSSVPAAMKTLELGLLALFVAAYVYAMAGRGWVMEVRTVGAWTCLAVLGALATILALLPGTTWLGLFIFVAAAAGQLRPMAYAWYSVLLTALVALALERHTGQSGFGPDPAGVIFLLIEIVAVGGLVLGVTRLVEVNRELRESQAVVAQLAVSEERLRFARDVHDVVGHHLTVIVRKSELAARLMAVDRERAAQEVRDIEQVAREALADTRDVVSGYRRPSLAAEIEGARRSLEAAGLRVTVRQEERPLDHARDEVLAWAVREATTNVLRHTRASRVHLCVSVDKAGAAELEIVDDGPSEPVRRTNDASGGHGLTGLAERVRVLGGSVVAGPLRPFGFRLTVRLPAQAANAVGGEVNRDPGASR
jgi:two-component system sensor histidine kinase DesK